MVEGRLSVCVGRFVRSLYVSMFFYNSGNGGGVEGPRSFGLGGSVWGGHWNTGIAISVTAMAGLALAATLVYTRRGNLKSPWSRRRRKHTLSPEQWKNLFSADGKLRDGGVKFLKKVRSGGVDPSIRAEVWPFLLGVYDLDSTSEERDAIRMQKRKEYEQFRRKCRRLLKNTDESYKDPKEVVGGSSDRDPDSPSSKDIVSARQSVPILREHPDAKDQSHFVSEEASHTNSCMEEENKSTITHCEASDVSNSCMEEENKSSTTHLDDSAVAKESSDTESSVEDSENTQMHHAESTERHDSPKAGLKVRTTSEDFSTWQRIIRLDAVRANAEWAIYSPAQAAVSEDEAQRLAQAVHLKDYDHLEPCSIFHASRLVAVLEAYALYDPEIGYCQGMSDLLSPIITVMDEDYQAFWCFVGFMRKARHNFRLDEVGIRRQLNIVSKIIKSKDSHLYRHLEKLQAEDCFFVYRMVVVLFRRELSFEQTVCLWEVMWADQAAIRAGIGKLAVWGRMRQRVPPTDDLLLYAISASVLQKRKLIIEKYSSMDEIIRECNSMAGQLDVWKLLDDAHELVVTLHDKI